jgi:hypothetical protein
MKYRIDDKLDQLSPDKLQDGEVSITDMVTEEKAREQDEKLGPGKYVIIHKADLRNKDLRSIVRLAILQKVNLMGLKTVLTGDNRHTSPGYATVADIPPEGTEQTFKNIEKSPRYTGPK